MPNKTPWSFGLMVAIGLALTLTAGIAIGERPSQHRGSERAMIQNAVEDAGPVSFWAVVQKFSGSLEESGAHLGEFMKHFEEQGLDEGLVGFEPTAIIVLNSQPEGRMAHGWIGLTVPSKMEVKEPLVVERIRFSEAATYVHNGPYEELGELHAMVTASAKSSRGASTEWPVVLRLLNDPRVSKVAKSQLVVPIEQQQSTIIQREERAAIARAVENASAVSVRMVSQKFEGSPEQIGKFLEEFMHHFEAQGLGEALSSRDAVPVAILHGDPDRAETIGIEIGLPVQKQVDVKDPLTYSDFGAARAVSYVHRGAYEQLGDVYHEIERDAGARLQASSTFPVALRLISDPRLALEDDIKTEIIVPLKKG